MLVSYKTSSDHVIIIVIILTAIAMYVGVCRHQVSGVRFDYVDY